MTHADMITCQYNALVEMYNTDIFANRELGLSDGIVFLVNGKVIEDIVKGMEHLCAIAKLFEQNELAHKIEISAWGLDLDRIPPMPI